jgi:hypothetical protein
VRNSDRNKYKTNLGNQQVREYIAGQFIRNLKGGKTWGGESFRKSGFNGIYLDMTSSTWDPSRWGSYADVREYGNVSFRFGDDVYGYVCSANAVLKKYNFSFGGSNFWNSGYRQGAADYSTGGGGRDVMDCMDVYHSEFFASTGWADNIFAPQEIERHFAVADQYLAAGKKLLLSSGTPGAFNSDTFKQNSRFLLAAFLMVTDGRNAYFFQTPLGKGVYWTYFADLPEYHYNLGAP